MNNFTAVPYNEKIDLSSDVTVRFQDAGHILGSSIIEIWIKNSDKPIKIVVAADLGSNEIPLLRTPSIVPEGDYILIESTYGTIHRELPDYREFGKTIRETLNQGGSVLIPAFVLEKTQRVLYVIGQLKRDGIIPLSTPVYADSTTAHEITKIYRKYTKYYDSEALRLISLSIDPLSFSQLNELSGKDAMKTHDRKQPAIYLSSSGMLDHAYAPKHLEQMIDAPKNLLLIVGWQAPGSLGRKLQEGAKKISIPIENFRNGEVEASYVEKPVRMKVMRFGGFSSHADGCELLQWLSHFSKLKEVFVVHGDKDNAIALARAIESKLGFNASSPALGEVRYLSSAGEEYAFHRSDNLCEEPKAAARLENLGSISDQ